MYVCKRRSEQTTWANTPLPLENKKFGFRAALVYYLVIQELLSYSDSTARLPPTSQK